MDMAILIPKFVTFLFRKMAKNMNKTNMDDAIHDSLAITAIHVKASVNSAKIPATATTKIVETKCKIVEDYLAHHPVKAINSYEATSNPDVKVAYVAGEDFYVERGGKGNNCMRISFGGVIPEKIRIGAERLGKLVCSKLK